MLRNALRRFWNFLVRAIEVISILVVLFYGYREFLMRGRRTGEIVFSIPQAARVNQMSSALHLYVAVNSGDCRGVSDHGRTRYTCPTVEDTFVWPWQYNQPEATMSVRLSDPSRCLEQRWDIRPGTVSDGDITVTPKEGNGCMYGWTVRRTWR